MKDFINIEFTCIYVEQLGAIKYIRILLQLKKKSIHTWVD